MFLYFGSKAGLAHTYQPPQHDLIVEPFAGAAGYSIYWLQRRADLRCLLMDSDPRVVELWDAILELRPEDLWEYPALQAGDWTADPIYKAAHVSAGSWNKPAGSEYRVTEWMARDFPVVRRRMAAKLAAVQGRVSVQLGDYRSVPNTAATWFIDPPYQAAGHWYGSGNDLDWARLGEWCRTRSGQVIVCEADGADWMDFGPHVSHKTVANDMKTELVWYSHPEPTLLDLMA